MNGQDTESIDGLRHDVQNLTVAVGVLGTAVDVLKGTVTFLTGQLSVKCPAEAEKHIALQSIVIELRGEMMARCNGLSNRLWGFFGGLALAVLGTFIVLAIRGGF